MIERLSLGLARTDLLQPSLESMALFSIGSFGLNLRGNFEYTDLLLDNKGTENYEKNIKISFSHSGLT